MNLTKEDIKKMEKVGDSAKGEVYHVLTKGGFNMIIQKSAGGELRVLGRGAHRAFARNQADSLEKIEWNESLWKSEDLQKDDAAPKTVNIQEAQTPIQSNPQNHYDLAAYHSKMAGKFANQEKQMKAADPSAFTHDQAMSNLMHSDFALKHYQMSGLDPKMANQEHKKQMMLHHEMQDGQKSPFKEHELELAWRQANPGKKAPSGLGYNWSE